MTKKVTAIIQARTSSTRLTAKVLKPILGRPMIAYMLERVKRAKTLDSIILATSDKPSDDALEAIAKGMGVNCFRGSEHNVLDRYYQAATQSGLAPDDTIICLLADCPFQHAEIIDEGVSHFLEEGDPHAFAGTVLNYPEGFDFNVFTFGALKEAWENAQLPSEFEHVARYFINHPERFRPIQWTTGTRDDSSLHWSVDTSSDFEFVKKVFEVLYPKDPNFGKDDIIKLLELHPEYAEINKGGTGYEGLAKSLKEDEEFKRKRGDLQ